MTIKENVEFILLKYPATKFHRAEFLLSYLVEFHQSQYKDLNYEIPAIELRQFLADLETIWRTVREFLKKDKRFELPIEANLKRKRLQKDFQMNFKPKKETILTPLKAKV